MKKYISILLVFVSVLMPVNISAQKNVQKDTKKDGKSSKLTTIGKTKQIQNLVSPRLTIEGKSESLDIEFSGRGGERELKFYSLPVKLSVSGVPAWMRVAIDNNLVTITCSENRSKKDSRKCKLTFSNGMKNMSVNVTQGKKDATTKNLEITEISLSNKEANGKLLPNLRGNLIDTEMRYLMVTAIYNLAGENNETHNFKVAIYGPDHKLLSSGKSSGQNYTYTKEVTLRPGTSQKIELSGWGSEYSGFYKPGKYRIDIIEGHRKLLSKEFTILENPLFRVDALYFGNKNLEGDMISDYGEPLDAGTLQYLALEMEYSNSTYFKPVKVEVRIVDSDGNLVKGEKGLTNRTYTHSVSLEPGENKRVEISGWGSSQGGYYKAGNYKAEVFVDGNRLITTPFTIESKGNPRTRDMLKNILVPGEMP